MSSTPHKPKPIRIETPGTARFLTFGCYRRKRLFRFYPVAQFFVKRLIDQSNRAGIHVWAWVVMPNHVHLMVFAPDGSAVRPFLSNIKRLVSRDALSWLQNNHLAIWNDLRDNNSTARFWQHGVGHDLSVWSPEKIGRGIIYIHDNPVRAGLVNDASEWRWRSCREWETGCYTVVAPDLVPVFSLDARHTHTP